MLKYIPDDFPFTLCLADCPGDNIHQIAEDFDLSAVLTPAVVCAVSTKKYMADKNATLQSTDKALVFTKMADVYINKGITCTLYRSKEISYIICVTVYLQKYVANYTLALT